MKEVLLLCDDQILLKWLHKEFRPLNISTIDQNTIQYGTEVLQQQSISAVLIKLPLLAEHCPKKMIKEIKKINPYVPIYFLMDQINHSDIITVMKQGAENIFIKPFDMSKIASEVQTTVNRIPLPQSPEHLTTEASKSYKYLRASSKAAQFMYQQIDKVAETNFTVIIYGETGTGKESVARRLCEGKYSEQAFVAVDCGCLNKELAASELFGHNKGSFTNAHEDKKGAFELAHNGTLFLDEIGNLDYNVQILLLRAIEEKKIRPVGSHKEIDVNVRIIVASNEKLINAVKAGTFREDLYYRLNEFEINIPPLRKRKEDIEPFIQYFIQQANQDLNKNIKGVEPELMNIFIQYSWPGNIRELKNVIRRGCLMADEYINSSCMTNEFLLQFRQSQEANKHFPKDPIKNLILKTEYEQIMQVLIEENYNKSSTAQRLNMNRKTLYNKLKNYELYLKSLKYNN